VSDEIGDYIDVALREAETLQADGDDLSNCLLAVIAGRLFEISAKLDAAPARPAPKQPASRRRPVSPPAQEPSSSLLLTPEQAAAELHIARRRIFEMIADGTLPSVKIGKSRRIARTALEDYVRGLSG
jgi:excisionase family DNA binding protein